MTAITNKASSTGKIWSVINGNCMIPLIATGDIVMIDPVKELKSGDLILVHGDPPMVHRVVKISRDGYVITKGDASFTLDDPVQVGSIAGKVRAIVRKNRKTVFIKGAGWQLVNSLIANYSYSSYYLFNNLSKHKWSSSLCHFFSPLMIRFHTAILKVISLMIFNRTKV